jgi:predicted amidophosphoribosyltransferase
MNVDGYSNDYIYGHQQKFETTYSSIGLEMNHLKYWKERYRAERIGVVAAEWLQKQLPTWKINVIIPIPPSDTTREFQPVYEIVKHIGSRCSLPIDLNVLKKEKATKPQKGIVDVEQRQEELKDAFQITNNNLAGKNVLLFDDLYRSGVTLNTVCDIVIKHGKAANVYVLTITKTRKKR